MRRLPASEGMAAAAFERAKTRRPPAALGILRTVTAAVILLGYCTAASLAHSPHVVQRGETLGSIARDHLGSTARWREIAAANGLTNPHDISPGLVLRITTRDASDVASQVVGTGEYRETEAAPWRRLAAGASIPRSAEVRTETDALVSVRSPEGAQFTIRGWSHVRLPPAEGGRRNLVLLRGAMTAQVRRGARVGHTITTPVAVAGVRGTTFLVDYDADALRNAVSVREGLVNHTAAEVTIGVGAGYGSWAVAGSPPSPAAPLPSPPQLISPGAGTSLAAPAAEFRWRPAAGALSYLLEIALDADFSRLVLARVVDDLSGDSLVAARVGHLPTGPLYWRVAARTAQALEGLPASARRLVLTDPLATLRALYRKRAFVDVIAQVNELDSPGFQHALLRASAYYRLGLIDQADNAYRVLHESDPSHVEVTLGLAYCAFRLGRGDEAERGFRAVLEADPASSEALLGLAHLRYREERWEEAIALYEQCLRLSPGHGEATEYLQKARLKGRR